MVRSGRYDLATVTGPTPAGAILASGSGPNVGCRWRRSRTSIQLDRARSQVAHEHPRLRVLSERHRSRGRVDPRSPRAVRARLRQVGTRLGLRRERLRRWHQPSDGVRIPRLPSPRRQLTYRSEVAPCQRRFRPAQTLERVTGIEPAWPAWRLASQRSGCRCHLGLGLGGPRLLGAGSSFRFDPGRRAHRSALSGHRDAKSSATRRQNARTVGVSAMRRQPAVRVVVNLH